MTMRSRVRCAVTRGEKLVRMSRLTWVGFLLLTICAETPTKVSRSSTGPHPDSIRDEIRTESVQDMPKGAGWKPDEAPEVPLAVTHEKKQPPEVLGPVPDVPMKTQHDGEPRVNGGDEEAPVIEEAPSQEIPQEAQARVAPEAAPQAAPREAREAQAVPEAAQDGKEAQAASEVPKAPEVPEVQPVPEPAPEPETAAEPAKPAPEASTHTSQPPSEEAEAPQGLPGPRRTYPRQDAKSKRKRSVSQEQPSPENVTAPEAPIETFQPPKEKSPQELPESKRLSSRRGAKGKRKRESPEQPSQEDITASGPPPEAPRPREEAPQGLPEPKHTSRQNAKDKRTRESPEEKPSDVTAPEVTEAPTEASQPQEPQEAPEARRTSPRRGARGKRRRGSPEQLSPAGVAVPEAGEDAPEPEQPLEQQDYVDEAPIKSQEKRRGHPASARELDNDKEPEGEAVDSASQKQSKGRRGRKAKNREVPTTKKPSQPDVEDEAQPKETTEVRPQLPKENATRKRGRPGKKAAPESQGSREPEAVQVELAAPARGPDDRTGPAAEQPAAKRPTEPEPEQPEQPKEQQAPAEANKPTKRKPRSRGETVPVTVHRLANIATLGNFPDSDSEESADELATRQKTRHPNRRGVNQADVLNQICRETLDKTLTTLKNGITNETNPTRKAEWTRKKKAVEAFGAELEGRLFEMSEMLDSNFVLGVQVRRAKREMMEMRSRLYHVRREREAIAVQMDGVRRRYAEEESVRVVSHHDPTLTSYIFGN